MSCLYCILSACSLLLVFSAVGQASSKTRQTLEQAVVKANDEFGWDLFRQLNQRKLINTFISPFSLSTLLGMVYLGAEGNTKSELQRGLHLTDNFQNPDMLAKGHKKVLKIVHRGRKSNDSLYSVNNIFPATGFVLKHSYLRQVGAGYNVMLPEAVDFNNGDSAARAINTWVANSTNQHIRDLFTPDSFNQDTKLVLVSAVYFCGSWKKPFSVKDTRKEKFRLNSRESKNVDMMCMYQCRFPYFHDKRLGFKVVELPYLENRMSMIIILPEDIDGLTHRTIQSLTSDNIRHLRNSLSRRNIEVLKIPKFKIEAKYDHLSQELTNLNMTSLFSSSANLSGMSREPLVVSELVQQTFIQVDEKGTQAGAASGARVTLLSIGPQLPSFVANHPFLFLLVHKHTSANLTMFQGVVTDPSIAMDDGGVEQK